VITAPFHRAMAAAGLARTRPECKHAAPPLLWTPPAERRSTSGKTDRGAWFTPEGRPRGCGQAGVGLAHSPRTVLVDFDEG